MSYVYLMKSLRDYDTIYKIGYSTNPSVRKINLQTGNDGEISLVYVFQTKYGKKLETALHNFYSHARKNLEWFDLSLKEVVEFPNMCIKIEKNLELIQNSCQEFNI